MRHRRVLGVVLACLLAPIALYALLPIAAAAGLTYFLHRQGYHHVTLQLGYPGWHTLQVPVLAFQKDLDDESLSVTVQDSRLQYDIGVLFSGRVYRLTISWSSDYTCSASAPPAPCAMSASPGYCTRPVRQPMAQWCSRASGARPIV